MYLFICLFVYDRLLGKIRPPVLVLKSSGKQSEIEHTVCLILCLLENIEASEGVCVSVCDTEGEGV